ncbi:MAG: hypothetical protein KDB07_11365, partial [Planctomycetes bacterium]|nr:hypothetical protein [Planctomycetota bacterium]
MSDAKDSEALSRLLDGRLSAESARMLRARVEEDPELYARYKALESAREIVRADSGIQQLPQGFDARLKQRLHSEELRSRAEIRAKSQENRPGVALQRTALAFGSMAAGVALALALGPAFGLNLFNSGIGEGAPNTIVLESKGSSRVSADYFAPIVAKKLAALRDVESLVAGIEPGVQ